jgi:hypothetical protein
MRNSKDSAKKSKQNKYAEFSFVNGGDFLKTLGVECKDLPSSSIVLNGVLWESTIGAREYEAFVPVEKDNVAYGRVSFEKVNGQDYCHFHRMGRVMGKNRLDLPSVSFSESAVNSARLPASAGGQAEEFNLEFLRFSSKDKPTPISSFTKDGRQPSSVKEQERPALIFRIFRISSKTGGDRGEWTGTQEYIYRLWKTD